MTKGNLKKALAENQLPDDTEVFINVSKYFSGEATWDDIDDVDGTEHGAPILIELGKTVMG